MHDKPKHISNKTTDHNFKQTDCGWFKAAIKHRSA